MGYVLSSSDGWLKVLTDEERLVDVHTATDVTSRSICSPNGADQDTSPAQRLGWLETTEYPACTADAGGPEG